MSNFCNIDFNNLQSQLETYNEYVELECMSEEEFNDIFSDLTDEQRASLKEEVFKNDEWITLSQEFIDAHSQSRNEDGSPEQTGDPTLDDHNLMNYNTSTVNTFKIMILRYINSSFVLGNIKDEFRDKVFKTCLYDYEYGMQCAPDEISKKLSEYKIELCQTLCSLLGLNIDLNSTTSENLTLSIQNTLLAAAEEIQSEVLQNKSEVRKAFYTLVYFDDMLKDLDFVTRNTAVPTYAHTLDMYTPKFGNDNVRNLNFRKDDKPIDMDEITSNLTKEIMNYLPLVSKDGTVSKTMKVGWNGFQRSVTTFMEWAKENLDKDLLNRITDGDIQALATGIQTYLKDEQKFAGSAYNTLINTEVLRSLLMFVFPTSGYTNMPEKLQNLFFNQLLKTAKHAYLGYDYDPRDKSINLNLIEDKAIRSESSRLTNIITGRITDLLQNPELYNKLFDKQHGKIQNLVVQDTFAKDTYSISFSYFADSGIAYDFEFLASKVAQGNDSTWKFNVCQNSNTRDHQEILNDLVYDIFGYNLGLPETQEDKDVVKSFIDETLSKGTTLVNLFADPICITLLGALKNTPVGENDYRKNIEFSWTNIDTINLKSYFKNYDDLAKYQYWCAGYDSKNVVRDIKGDKIPVYALTSAIFQYDSLLYKANESSSIPGSLYNNIKNYNPLLGGHLTAKSPIIRNGMVTALGSKTTPAMNSSELLISSAFLDYGKSLLFDPKKKVDGYRAHRLTDGNTILIQFTVFSDKSQTFITPFSFTGSTGAELKSKLVTLASDSTPEKIAEAESYLTGYIQQWQRSKYLGKLNEVAQKFITAFSKSEVFGNDFNGFEIDDGTGNLVLDLKAINKLNVFIKKQVSNKEGLEYLRAKFKKANLELVEEIDYCKSGLNQAFIYKLTNLFATPELTANYMELQKRLLIQDIANNNTSLYETSVSLDAIPISWKKNKKIRLYKIYDKAGVDITDNLNTDEDNLLINGQINPEYRVELNPVLNSWLYADGICSQAYEEIFFGLNENNPNKASDSGESSASGRLLAHYKRTVPAGSTVHLYQQGLINGVPKQAKVAIIDDAIFPYATNSTGEVYGEEPHNGSAWSNPLYSIWARHSLGSAASGLAAAKTIFHDVDENGNGMLCKWATYNITNAQRRTAENSKFSMENLHKKMNSTKLGTDIFTNPMFNVEYELNTLLSKHGPLYVNDPFVNEVKKISKISVQNYGKLYTIQVTYEASDGTLSTKTFGQNGLTIYDLDLVFGGAWVGKKFRDQFDYVEAFQTEILAEFLEKVERTLGIDYKPDVTCYVINKSAFKRGAKNVNNSNVLENDTQLQTTHISTKFGGLMLNSEHNIDSTVRETSQIMSSLVQNGYSEKEAHKIYSDIGKIIESTANSLFEHTTMDSDQRIAVIEQMLVRSLEISKNEGIGVSDAIILYAQKEVKDKEGNIKRLTIPFSLADIKNKFIATVNAYLTNEAILRRYPGVQGVNTPSRGIIQYYNFGSGSYNYESAIKKVSQLISEDEVFRLCSFFDENLTLDPQELKELAIKHAFNPYKKGNPVTLYNELCTQLGLKGQKNELNYLRLKKEAKGLPFNLFKAKLKLPIVSAAAQLIQDQNVQRLWEMLQLQDTELITDICEGQFLQLINQPKQLKIGQTIIVKRKGDNFYRKVILESAAQRDKWCNLVNPIDYEIYQVTLAPEDLKQPQLQLKVSTYNASLGITPEDTKTEWDLDVVRAMYYYRELNSKKGNVEFAEIKQDLINKVLNKIKSFGNEYNFSRQLLAMPTDISAEDQQKIILKVLRNYQQEIIFQLKEKGQLTSEDTILGRQDAWETGVESSQRIKLDKVSPGEIAISAAYAEQYRLREGDDLGVVLEQGEQFFRDRLDALPVVSDDFKQDQYDAVALDDLGNQIIIKVVPPGTTWETIDENGDSLFIEDGEFLDRRTNDVHYQGSFICSNDNWEKKHIKIGKMRGNGKGRLYTTIVLQDISDLRLFENAGIIDSKYIMFNYRADNQKALVNYEKENWKYKKKTGEWIIPNATGEDFLVTDLENPITLDRLRYINEQKSYIYANRRAKELAKSFQDSLLYFGTRIPSQALQSGMALKVKLFVGSGGNQVFIPGAMHWFEGADYDIDKTYMMRLGIRNGRLDVLSDLYEDFGLKVTTLPIPNKNLQFELRTPGDASTLTAEIRQGLRAGSGRFFYNGTHYVNASALVGTMDHTKNNDEMFKSVKKILEDTEVHPESGKYIYVINDLSSEYGKDDYEELANILLDHLNTHNRTKLNNSTKVAKALMNRNVINAREILLDPLNYISASDPISFGEIQDYAKNSTLGGREKYVSIWNGMSKWIMQEQFMLGKQEIGTIATAIKTFLMKTNVVNAEILNAADAMRSGNIEEALTILDKYVYNVVDLNGAERLALLANVNFRPLYEAMNASLNGGTEHSNVNSVPTKFRAFFNNVTRTFNTKQMLDELSTQNAQEDVLMALSALLSAATDNAKELILSKINASQSSVDLFCAMLGTGYSLKEILDVFSSPWFTVADTLMKDNLFSKSGNTKNLSKVIGFISGNESLLSPKYENRLMEMLNCPEFLFKPDKDGKIVQTQKNFKFDKAAWDYYVEYISTITDVYGTYQGNPNASTEAGKSSTKKKRLRFVDILTRGRNLETTLSALEEFYTKIVERDEQLHRAKKKSYNDPDSDPDDGVYPDIDSNPAEDDNIPNDADEGFNYDDYPDPDEMGGKTRIIKNLTFMDFTIEDCDTIRSYLDDVRFKNKMSRRISAKFPGQNKSMLTRIAENVIPVADENKILGRIAKINQGLVSSSEELYNYIKSIELYFNNELRRVSKDKERQGYPNTFELSQFLNDPVYRDRMIEVFDELKKETNILRILIKSDNFFNMFKVYRFALENKEMQYESSLTWKLADKVLQQIYEKSNAHLYHKVTSEQYRTIASVVTDVLTFSFLKTLPEEQRVFKYQTDTVYYPGVADQRHVTNMDWNYDHPVVASREGTIDLGTVAGAATFKRWMNTSILSQLKDKYKQNSFIRALHSEKFYDKNTRQSTSYLTLGLDMNNIKNSVKLKAQFNEIKKAYDAIATDEIDFNGNKMKLRDLFYLYNLIQNKGKSSNNSFNILFGDQIINDIMNEDSILHKHWKFLGDLDNVKNDQERSQLEVNVVDSAVKDIFWRFADNNASKIQVNAQTQNNRINPLTDSSGRLVGYKILNTPIYFIGGDFTFNLPFTGNIVYNQNPSIVSSGERTHFFSNLGSSATRVQTKTFLMEALGALGIQQIKVLESSSDFDALTTLTNDEKAVVHNWSVFAVNGTFYVNLDTIEDVTPARVLIPLMSAIANNYQENGKYIYRNMWNNLLKSLKNSALYDYYYQKTFGEKGQSDNFYESFAGTSVDELVLATYITDEIITQHPFRAQESIAQTDVDFHKGVTTVVNRLLGTDFTPSTISDISLKSTGEILKQFRPMARTAANPDFSTIVKADTQMKQLIKKMIKENHLTIEGNC